jgi:glycerol transport system ATP-binding protein
VPPGFSTNSNTAGLRFDASHVHVYADSRLVEGTA